MRLLRILIVPALAFIGLVPPTGCTPPVVMASAGFSAAQAGVSMFVEGRLQSAWEVPLPEMYEAAHAVLIELGYPIEGRQLRADEGFVAAREPDGRTIEAYTTRSSDRVTILSVRVGIFGDQPLSRLITDRVDGYIRDRHPEFNTGRQRVEPRR